MSIAKEELEFSQLQVAIIIICGSRLVNPEKIS